MTKTKKQGLYFKLEEGAILPEYKTPLSSGFDLHANLVLKPMIYDGAVNVRNANNPTVNAVKLKPFSRVLIKTGLKPVSIPHGYELQIRGRSGISLQKGIILTNGIGTIDNDYRGDIGIILSNPTNNTHIITHGDRIAQAVLVKVEQVLPINANDITDVEFEDSERGEGGFGSTGDK